MLLPHISYTSVAHWQDAHTASPLLLFPLPSATVNDGGGTYRTDALGSERTGDNRLASVPAIISLDQSAGSLSAEGGTTPA